MKTPSGNADVPVGIDGKAANEAAEATKEWHSRGYLPHRDKAHLIQSVTFRLADSLPQSKLEGLEEELHSVTPGRVNAERRQKIEAWLDSGMGCCSLRHPDVADYVEVSLKHFHGERYNLHAWCIMPNHVHVLVEPIFDLATIVQGWKSYTARWILNQDARLDLGIPASQGFWMREYWDHYMRDENHYLTAVDYIHDNPVKAGLCRKKEDWRWSSAFPGNTDVPAGTTSDTFPGNADVPAGTTSDTTSTQANEDVGAPRTS
jgi:type I restriction enzyme R subunit/putative DNA methylase